MGTIETATGTLIHGGSAGGARVIVVPDHTPLSRQPLYEAVRNELLEGDLRVTSWDAVHEDESSEAWLDAMIEVVNGQVEDVVALVGVGLGAAVAIHTASRDERVTRLAMYGAPARLPNEARKGAEPTVVLANIAVLLCPVLVLHGERDAHVPASDAHDLACAARSATLEYAPLGDRACEDSATRNAVARRMSRFVGNVQHTGS